MEFNEKVQLLRKQKSLTQEELAEALYVSRTAVSKWESGRGYPNIESLKAIAKFFDVSIDELLSGDELLTLAEDDARVRQIRIRDQIFALLDCGAALYFILPLFRQVINDYVQSVSLLQLTQVSSYLWTAYSASVISIIVFGLMMFLLQNWQNSFWSINKIRLSLYLNLVGEFLYTISSQPYAAIFLLFILAFKVVILLKQQ